jgi:hypothetical protein
VTFTGLHIAVSDRISRSTSACYDGKAQYFNHDGSIESLLLTIDQCRDSCDRNVSYV